jgi:outer membrane protein OmpA-like peptidoglycan-associated protein
MGIVSRQITPDVIRSVSSRLGEDRGRTASALATSVPSVLTALSDVASTDTGAAHLKEMIDERRRRPATTATDTTAWFSSDGRPADRTVGFIDGELGTRANTLSDAVARSSGIRSESAHKLMGGIASVAVGALANSTGGMGSGALQSMLRDQRGEWVKRLPGPVASLFNGHGIATSTATTTERRVYEERVAGPAVRTLERPRGGRGGWLIPLIMLAAFLLAIPIMRGLWHPRGALPQHPQVTRVAAPPAPPAVETTPLPSAAKPRVGPAPSPAENPPAEAQAPPAAQETPPATAPAPAPGHARGLAAFLSGSGETPRTFSPKPLNFAFNSAELTPESQGTLDDVAAALTDHPSAKIRLESFTDSVGDPDSNMQLSTARSEAVKTELVQRGVPAESIDTAGRGQEQPIASNDTAAGRAQNRRTEIVVTER